MTEPKPFSAEALSPDLARVGDDLEALSRYCDPALPGWTRRVFSPLDWDAREWVAERMAAAGLEVATDTSANLIGRLPGTKGHSEALVTGSHTDTVRGGGRFDGIIGVLGAIEAARLLQEADIRLDHDLVVVDFLGEEPNDFGLSCVGSRAIAGNLNEPHLELVDPDGRTMGDALAAAGASVDDLAAARWEPERVLCFVELHIEQGRRLEQARTSIGVVSGIVGIHRLVAVVEGRPDHAGTTPMADRRDALVGAAEATLRIEALAEGGVSTVGRLQVLPGASNVVPAWAELWAEARSEDEGWLDTFGRRVEEELRQIGASRQLGTSLEWLSREEPVSSTEWVEKVVREASLACGVEPLELWSGAGHDAAQMAQLGPMGMIFVPSRDGRSHCPEEWTDLEDVGVGISVLCETLRRCDREDR